MKSLLVRLLLKAKRKVQRERLLKGGAILIAYLLVVSIVSTVVLAQENFSDKAILWSRILGLIGFLLILWKGILSPLLRPASLSRVSRFLEQRYPQLRDRVSTAFEVTRPDSEIDPAVRELVERDAYQKLKQVRQPRFYWPRISGASLIVAAIAVLLFSGLYLGGPTEFAYSINKLLGSWADPDQPPIYDVLVTPGNTTVGERGDLEVRARLVGFDAREVTLNALYENQPQWESVQMYPDGDTGEYTFLFFDIREPIDYYVEAEGIRSDDFRIEVSDVPRATKIIITLSFPSYTGLSDATYEDEPMIRALEGTRVSLEITTDQPVRRGFLRFEEADEIPLELLPGGTLKAEFKIIGDDFFRLHFANSEGVLNPGSDEFVIQALKDQKPVISFNQPGRDRAVTNIEEVYSELQVEDDHGISGLKLHYSVNGGTEQTADLSFPRGAKHITSSHTFYLEELDLLPGDFVSYYGKASDSVSTAVTDIFFLEVEPFDKEYVQSQAGGGGAMGGDRGLELARQQKQIVVATFSLIQEKEQFEPEEVKESSQTLALVQQRLVTQVETIVDRIERRGQALVDERFKKMAEHLTQAKEHMKPAETALNEVALPEALPEAQKALQQLLRAEALFNRMQVSMSQSGSSGGASPEELADLVDLELDRTKNQYETLQQAREQQQDEAIDDALEKLQELARRQEQQLERQRRKGTSGSSGGQVSQQELIDEIEELARQLARLSRQKQDRQLSQVSRELNRAARDMKEASSSGQNSQQSQQMAQQGLERLKEAQEALAEHREDQMRSEFDELKERAERLESEQRNLVRGLSELESQFNQSETGEKFFEGVRTLFWRKQDMRQELQELEGELHQSARRMQSEEPEAARQLKDAGNSIRDDRIPEKMQESSDLLANGLITMARSREAGVSEDLRELTDKIRSAEEALGAAGPESDQEKLKKALDRAGELVEKLESLKQLAEAQRQGQDSQQEGQESPEGQAKGEQGQPSNEPGSQQSASEGSPQGQQQGQSQGQNSPSNQQQAGESSGGRASQIPSGSAGSRASSGIDPKQAGREWQERLREAQELSQMLGENPDLRRQASRLLQQMKGFDPSKIFKDEEEVRQLKAQVIDGLHQLELEISQALLKDNEQFLRPVSEDEVAPEFRDRVADYYRRLATRGKE
jgi:hypothetical protein